MNEVLIRHAKPSDYQPIIGVVDAWWGGRPMAAMLPKLFFEHFQPTSFVATQDGEIVGFVIGFVSQTYPDEAYLHFVGVRPESRGSGLGRKLYERFFAAVKDLKCRMVRSVTSPVNKDSIAFHRRMGFSVEDGEKKIDGVAVTEGYDGKGEDRVLFCKALSVEQKASLFKGGEREGKAGL